jgi:hypothetical protein
VNPMGKRNRIERRSDNTSAATPEGNHVHTRKLLQMVTIVAVIGIVLAVLMRHSPTGNSSDAMQGNGFTQVGREGPVFTVSVPRARANDDAHLVQVAERLSSEEIKAGGSGQVSVMVWPDDVPVPKVPPTTEFDASMKTQVAGIFINPKLKIKHLIRFRDGETVAEKDFGARTQ